MRPNSRNLHNPATQEKRDCSSSDVYNMQLSNEPAEKLAEILIKSGNGAFELCGFASGGMYCQISPVWLAVSDRLVHESQVQKQWRVSLNLPDRFAASLLC